MERQPVRFFEEKALPGRGGDFDGVISIFGKGGVAETIASSVINAGAYECMRPYPPPYPLLSTSLRSLSSSPLWIGDAVDRPFLCFSSLHLQL